MLTFKNHKKQAALALTVLLLTASLFSCAGRKPADAPETDTTTPAAETPETDEQETDAVTPDEPDEPESPPEPEDSPTNGAPADFVPAIRLAVCSDTHITDTTNERAVRLGKLFDSAYRYADAHPTYQNLDAVVMAGDITNTGWDYEYKALNAIIASHIRPETRLLATMGNHEWIGGGLSYLCKDGRPSERPSPPMGGHVQQPGIFPGRPHSIPQGVCVKGRRPQGH